MLSLIDSLIDSSVDSSIKKACMDNLPSLRPRLLRDCLGYKEVFLSNERYVYDSSHYLLVTAELSLVVSVMVEAGDIAPKKHTDVKAVNVSSMNCASAQS